MNVAAGAIPRIEKLTIWQKLGYGTGDLASNLVFQIVINFLQAYYTDTLLLDPARIALIFGVVRLVDAITDPLMGGIADRTHTKWGQFRPWLLWLAVPFGAAYLLAFSVGGFDEPAKSWLVFGSYFLLLLVYTAINIPYGAMCTAITNDPTERMSLRSWQFVMTQIGNTIVAAATLPLVAVLGQGDDLKGFQLVVTIYSVLAVVLFLVCFLSTRERISSTGEIIGDDYDAEKAAHARRDVSIFQDLKALFKNDQWVVLAISTFLILIAIVLRGSNTFYFGKYVLEDESMVTVYLTLGGISAIVGSVVAGRYSGGFVRGDFFITAAIAVLVFVMINMLAMSGWVGHIPVTIVVNSIIAMAMGTVVSHFLGRSMNRVRVFTTIFVIQGIAHGSIVFVAKASPDIAIFLFVFASFFTQVGVTTLWSMLSDSVDYGQYKTGVRNNGLIFSSFLFALKMGVTVAGVLGGLILAATGYVANEAQSATALRGIVWAFAIIPGICYLLVALVSRRLKLTEAYVLDVQAKIEESFSANR